MLPRTPGLLRRLFPKVLFRLDTGNRKEVFLTFDDGPQPEVTDFVLATLATFEAKASFFLVGNQAAQFPDLVNRIKSEEHSVGHHTQNHLNALQVSKEAFLDDVKAGAETVGGLLFRPPYGKLTPAIYNSLKSNYRIVLWDIIAEDYEQSYTAEQCLQKVLKQLRPGSIIVLHDSVKCHEKLQYLLPELLKELNKREYRVLALPKEV